MNHDAAGTGEIIIAGINAMKNKRITLSAPVRISSNIKSQGTLV
jgi:hypothetical protein